VREAEEELVVCAGELAVADGFVDGAVVFLVDELLGLTGEF
jgi:hypothetical protein